MKNEPLLADDTQIQRSLHSAPPPYHGDDTDGHHQSKNREPNHEHGDVTIRPTPHERKIFHFGIDRDLAEQRSCFFEYPCLASSLERLVKSLGSCHLASRRGLHDNRNASCQRMSWPGRVRWKPGTTCSDDGDRQHPEVATKRLTTARR